MARLSTWYANLHRKLLAARESRQAAIFEAKTGEKALMTLALNIPGEHKTLPGAHSLFLAVRRQLFLESPDLESLLETEDALGFFMLLRSSESPVALKQLCIRLEEASSVNRLIDLDVYTPSGEQLDRRALGYAPRTCLLCLAPAMECIRLKRHPLSAVCAEAEKRLETLLL